MNCTEFNNTLIHVSTSANDSAGSPVNDNGPDGLSVEQQAEFDAHRESCEICRASYEAEIALLAGLQKMPVPEPSAGFADRVLGAAIAQNGARNAGHHHRHGFLLGFGSAAVAALALWVVVGVFPGANSPVGTVADETLAANTAPATNEAPKPVLSIALNQQQDIKLAFYSGEPLKGARITIRLPENVALVGYPGRRQLSWTTDLKKGDNMLRLPVVATQIARGELVADIEYRDQLKTLTLGLEANASKTSTDGFTADGFIG